MSLRFHPLLVFFAHPFIDKVFCLTTCPLSLVLTISYVTLFLSLGNPSEDKMSSALSQYSIHIRVCLFALLAPCL